MTQDANPTPTEDVMKNTLFHMMIDVSLTNGDVTPKELHDLIDKFFVDSTIHNLIQSWDILWKRGEIQLSYEITNLKEELEELKKSKQNDFEILTKRILELELENKSLKKKLNGDAIY